MMEPETPELDEVVVPAPGPPLSVWLAVAVLIGPGVTLIVNGIATGSQVWQAGIVALLSVTPPAIVVLRGGAGGAFLAMAWAALAVVVAVVALTQSFATVDQLPILAGIGSWGATVIGLIWWPETRRWCAMLLTAHDTD